VAIHYDIPHIGSFRAAESDLLGKVTVMFEKVIQDSLLMISHNVGVFRICFKFQKIIRFSDYFLT